MTGRLGYGRPFGGPVSVAGRCGGGELPAGEQVSDGFAPQTAGGWARSAWIETRPDGRRHVTDSSRRWLAAQEDADGPG
jgi:hypothetical protein